MLFVVVKFLLTAAVIVLASEIAKRSDRWGALVVAMPLVTLLTLVWLYVEKQPEQKIANHAVYTFWYVLPTLPLFPVFPWFLRQWGFIVALLLYIAGTGLLFFMIAWILRRFGIELL